MAGATEVERERALFDGLIVLPEIPVSDPEVLQGLSLAAAVAGVAAGGDRSRVALNRLFVVAQARVRLAEVKQDGRLEPQGRARVAEAHADALLEQRDRAARVVLLQERAALVQEGLGASQSFGVLWRLRVRSVRRAVVDRNEDGRSTVAVRRCKVRAQFNHPRRQSLLGDDAVHPILKIGNVLKGPRHRAELGDQSSTTSTLFRN